jgi:hypothetical protein
VITTLSDPTKRVRVQASVDWWGIIDIAVSKVSTADLIAFIIPPIIKEFVKFK